MLTGAGLSLNGTEEQKITSAKKKKKWKGEKRTKHMEEENLVPRNKVDQNSSMPVSHYLPGRPAVSTDMLVTR